MVAITADSAPALHYTQPFHSVWEVVLNNVLFYASSYESAIIGAQQITTLLPCICFLLKLGIQYVGLNLLSKVVNHFFVEILTYKVI